MIRPTRSPFFPKHLFSAETAGIYAFTPAGIRVFVIGEKYHYYVNNHVFELKFFHKVLFFRLLGMCSRLITDLGAKWEVW